MTVALARELQQRKKTTHETAVPLLMFQLRAFKIQAVTEFRFHKTRMWRFDLAIPELKIAVECDGGGYMQGRHSRGAGMEKDAEKFAEAAIAGWTVIRCTPKHIQSGQALSWIERLIGASWRRAERTELMALSQQEINGLDPGIRDLVVRINEAGFITCDSGDGVSKPVGWYESGDALPHENVTVKVSPFEMLEETKRLAKLLGPEWRVEASYSPGEPAFLSVFPMSVHKAACARFTASTEGRP